MADTELQNMHFLGGFGPEIAISIFLWGFGNELLLIMLIIECD